jgi:hypothetical protein
MPHYIASSLLRATLQAAKRASGAQYTTILAHAGMQRYAEALPPPDDSPAMTAEEYSRLPAAVYTMLGEPLTRLFLRNLATLGAERMMHGHQLPGWAAAAQAVPPEQRVAWFVRWVEAMNGKMWSPSTVTEDDSAWYITMEICATCLSIHGASAPLCSNSAQLYQSLSEPIIGRKVRVAEVECAAMGAPHCKFAFYK